MYKLRRERCLVPCLWFAVTLWTHPLQPLTCMVLTKLSRKQVLNVLYQVCAFGSIRNPRWPPWLLIGWDIFSFSSATAERNMMKLEKKQAHNVLCKVCVFLPIRQQRWPSWPLIGWDIFSSSATAERNLTNLYRKQVQDILYQVSVCRANPSTKMTHGAWVYSIRPLSWVELVVRPYRWTDL